MAEDFAGIGLLERDTHGDVLWSWVYPTMPLRLRSVIERRIGISWDSQAAVVAFFSGQFQKQWHYCYTEDICLDKLPRVTRMSLILLTSDFNPEKYHMLSQVLMKVYKRSCSPSVLLENYLLVFTKGVCSTDENGTFRVQDHDIHGLLLYSKVKDIVQMFGLETILIYTAILLKKRVVVYHPMVDVLANVCRALPTFVSHRKNWNTIYPLVNISDDEITDLKESSAYVAGFVDSRIENRSDLYDILVNVHSKEISIASHAKDAFSMGKLHKDLATFMVEIAEAEGSSDIQCIKEISRKTKELINNLKSFSVEDEHGKSVVTLDIFKEKKMNSATRGFLISLASAEGMLKL